MENEYINYKQEIEKINQRVKEYLWKKWNIFNFREKESRYFSYWFLAGQGKSSKNN